MVLADGGEKEETKMLRTSEKEINWNKKNNFGRRNLG